MSTDLAQTIQAYRPRGVLVDVPTDDAPLAGYLRGTGVTVINFNDIRDRG